MIKKIITVLAMIMCVCTVAFANVSIEDVDGKNVIITFTFKDDTATEMAVIGSFNNWAEPGVAMTKNAEGLWEYKLPAKMTDELTYKFWNKGTYIFDFRAPDSKDDGFGANNGLIVVADALAKQALEAAVASGDTEAAAALAAVAPAGGTNIKFGNYTQIDGRVNFLTQSYADPSIKGFQTESIGLKLKSYWKFSGDVIANMPFYAEIKVADNVKDLYKVSPTGDIDVVAEDAGLFTGLFFNPIYYFKGANPELGVLKFGYNLPWITWETCYGWSKQSKYNVIQWETITDFGIGNGYTRFGLGDDLKAISGLYPIDAALYFVSGKGMIGYATADFDIVKVGAQYEFTSDNATFKDAELFKTITNQNIILGVETAIVPYSTIKANAMLSLVDDTDFNFNDSIVAKVNAEFAMDIFGATAGYAVRGANASFLYGKNDDLITAGMQEMWLNPWVKPLDFLKVSAEFKYAMAQEKPANSDSTISMNPKVNLDTTNFIGLVSAAEVFAKMNYSVAPSGTTVVDPFKFGELGFKYNIADISDSVADITLMYTLYNGDAKRLYNSIILTGAFANDINAQVGCLIRSAKENATQVTKDTNNLGFFVGANWKIPAPTVKNPILYTAFVYNMDPYEDEHNSIKLSDFKPDSLEAKNGKAQVRLGMKWDF